MRIVTVSGAMLSIAFAALAFQSVGRAGQKADAPLATNELKAYLRGYLPPPFPADPTTLITVASVPTAAGTPELIVYVTGRGWCGSGGCLMVVLEPDKSSFRVIGRVTTVKLPIKVLASMSGGHPDLVVRVQGGGIDRAYDAVLPFGDQGYPGSPVLPPARKVDSAQGKVLIENTDKSVSLFDR
jgi:hypothetical protein